MDGHCLHPITVILSNILYSDILLPNLYYLGFTF